MIKNNENFNLSKFEGEEWKQVAGYEGLYEISNLGRVKSLKANKGKVREKILRQGKMKNGYLKVIFHKEGKVKTFLIHRLVATAFLDNPSNLRCVNHKDENKENNCVDNLEWCTHQYNVNFGTCQKRISDKLSKQVYQYTKDEKLVAIWDSTKECKLRGFSQGNVSQCCRNCFKREGNNVYKGFIWSYTPL